MHACPLVSVIIPAYNAERFIHQTLDSVLDQTYQNFEVIVVDDGSRDRTADIVRTYCQLDARIHLIQQENAGVVAARNTAIQNSQGELIAPLDADDLWYPQKLEKQVQRMVTAEPPVGVVYCWSVYIDGRGRVLGKYPAHQLGQPEGDVLTALTFSNFLDHGSNPLVRRNCIDQVGGYVSQIGGQNMEGCEDWHFYLRMAEHYRFAIVPEYLIGYRQSLSSSVSANCVRMERSYQVVMADIRDRHPEIPAVVHHWALSSFYNYLLGKSYVNGDYRNALVWLFKGVINDPILLLRPGIYPALVFSSLKLCAQPIAKLIWKDHHAWMQFRQRLHRKDESSVQAEANDTLAERYPEVPEGNTEPSQKPYDRMYLHRWRTVMQINQELAERQAMASQTASLASLNSPQTRQEAS